MSPFFTVIVPLYKTQDYVSECLRSLQKQTFSDFEAICVNDASPDNTLQVARNAVKGDDRFIFKSLDVNSGLSCARNCGLDHAQGQVVLFLDSDDFLLPQSLEHIAAKFTTQELDDLYFNAESFYEDADSFKAVAEYFDRRPSFDGVTTGPALFSFFEEHGQFFPHAALRAIKRSLIEDNGLRFKAGMIHEDVLFTFQTLLLSQRSSFLNEPLYQRRVHLGSIMAAKGWNMRNIEGHLVSMRYLRDWVNSNIDSPIVTPAFTKAAASRINDYLELCARHYLDDISDDVKQEYLSSLSAKEHFDFQLDVVQRAEKLHASRATLTYRAGRAVTALPRAAYEKVKLARRKRG